MTLRCKTALATLAMTLLPFAAFAEDTVSTPADVTADVASDATSTGGTPGVNTCAGVCGQFFGEKSAGACNCDMACKNPKYNDCCPDIDTVCAPAADGLCAAKQCTGAGKTKDGKDSMCVCDPGCTQAGTCCSNFDTAGCSPAPVAGTCKGSDCAQDAKGKTADGSDADCYCDDICTGSGDCCDDKEQFCKSGATGGDAGVADVSSCIAKCTGKKCGEDDGCGGKCAGTCDNGGFCSASKVCTGGSTTDVATGGKDSGSLDASVKADTGTTGTVNTGTTSSSSGCTSGSSSKGGLGLALMLIGLVGAIVLRRRAV